MQLDDSMVQVGVAVISLLMAGNVFFIKRLVDKVEAAAETAKSAAASTNALGGLMREIKADIKDLRRVEIDVAVLKSALNGKPSKRKPQLDDELGEGT